MERKKKYDLIIVGASIAGLAHAYQAAQLGLQVLVIEKTAQTSINSFLAQGVLRPFGQMPGKDYHLALRSREVWIDLFEKLKLPYNAHGSYVIANTKEEFDVMEEFGDKVKKTAYKIQLLLPYQILEKTSIITKAGLWGGLYTPTEISFDVTELYARWLPYLANDLKVEFMWETQVLSVAKNKVEIHDLILKTNTIFVCCHSEITELFPNLPNQAVTTGKVHVTKLQPSSSRWKLGAVISGGLSLLHDNAIQGLNTLEPYKNMLTKNNNKLFEQNLHFLVSQSPSGQIFIGTYQNDISLASTDTQDEINLRVQKAISIMIQMPRTSVIEKDIHYYSSNCAGAEPLLNPETGIYIINALGQSGLNLSMGHAFDNMNRLMINQKSYVI